jgi:hypothetical protein
MCAQRLLLSLGRLPAASHAESLGGWRLGDIESLASPRPDFRVSIAVSRLAVIATASSDMFPLGGSCHAPSRERCRPRACRVQ